MVIVHLVNRLGLLVLRLGNDKTFLFCHIADVSAIFCHLGNALRKNVFCAIDHCLHIRNTFFLGDIPGRQCLDRFFCHLQQDRIGKRFKAPLLRHAGPCLSLRAERQI